MILKDAGPRIANLPDSGPHKAIFWSLVKIENFRLNTSLMYNVNEYRSAIIESFNGCHYLSPGGFKLSSRTCDPHCYTLAKNGPF